MQKQQLVSSLRVNLRFGPRTNPQLLEQLTRLKPYQRAKLLRQLLEEGMRARQDPDRSSPSPRARAPTTTPALARVLPDAGFSRDVLSLVGKSVRQ